MTPDRSTHCITIDGELTIFTATELRQQLLDALEIETEIDVDLSKVSEMDSAGIQLIVAAKSEAVLRNKHLHFSAPNSTVTQILALCNLSHLLDEPALIQRAAE